MKILGNIFAAVAFIVQYICPIVLFGTVIPYTRNSVSKGLTAMGIIALVIIALIISGKFKDKIKAMPHGLLRGALLSIFPVVFWIIGNIGIKKVTRFITEFSSYWGYLIIFIIIGRLLYLISEIMLASETEAKEKE